MAEKISNYDNLTAKDKAWLKRMKINHESGIFYIRWDSNSHADMDVMYTFSPSSETIESLRKFRNDCVRFGSKQGFYNSRISDGSLHRMS